MAGALTLQRSDPFPSSSPNVHLSYRWEVDFSRFFNFPRILSSSTDLKPLSNFKTRFKGTWISSSYPLSLCLVLESEPMLVVSMPGRILEEHFVSNLHFSWPQVSCTTDCPMRGSRVVFASFRNCHGQIQKFATRFSTGNEAHTFIDAVKKITMDIINMKFPGSDFGCENSSQSEYTGSNALQNRAGEESNFANQDVGHSPEMPVLNFQSEQNACSQKPSIVINVGHSPEMPVLNFQSEQNACSQKPSIVNNIEAASSDLPPSFTELLAGNSIDNEKDPPKAPEENDLKAQITRYLLDSSFHDMLVKVDKVIGELGGDLTL